MGNILPELGDFSQHTISGLMPHCFIDAFEIVKVDGNNGEFRFPFQQLADQFGNGKPVRQAGQQVGNGLLPHDLVIPFCFFGTPAYHDNRSQRQDIRE